MVPSTSPKEPRNSFMFPPDGGKGRFHFGIHTKGMESDKSIIPKASTFTSFHSKFFFVLKTVWKILDNYIRIRSKG